MADLKTKSMTSDTVDHEICKSLGCCKHSRFTIPPLIQQTTKSYLDYQKLCESLPKQGDDDYEKEDQLRADRDGQLSGLVSFRGKGVHDPFHYGGCACSGLLVLDVDEFDGEMWTDGGLFIFVIEDADIFDRLAAASFHREYRCIMICSGIRDGLPDIKSRWYLKKLQEDLKLPVLALVPCSPRGLTFLAIHRWGLRSDEYDFTIPDIKWLGFRPSDSGRFDIPKLVTTIKMTDEDLNLANDLLGTFSKDPTWFREIELMIKNGKYGRLSIGGNLLDCYLPCKLHTQDWLPRVKDTEQSQLSQQPTTKFYPDYQKLFESLSKLGVPNHNPKLTEFDDDYEKEQLRADRDGKLSGLVSFREKGIYEPFHYGGCGCNGPLVLDIDEIDGKMWSDGGLFIFVIEDANIFDRLSAASFHREYRCIMICSGIRDGLPDNKSRWYLKKLHEDLKLPVLALVPCSPRGLMFLAIHRWGLSSDQYDFTIPDIKWLGFRPSDSARFDIPKLVTTIKMTDKDLNLAYYLLDTFSNDPTWLKELELMIKNGKYGRLSIGGNLLDCYLPVKLHKRDWLPRGKDTEQPQFSQQLF